jgi:hypothetical protein
LNGTNRSFGEPSFGRCAPPRGGFQPEDKNLCEHRCQLPPLTSQ